MDWNNLGAVTDWNDLNKMMNEGAVSAKDNSDEKENKCITNAEPLKDKDEDGYVKEEIAEKNAKPTSPNSFTVSVGAWTDMKQFDNDHNSDWFEAEEKKLAEMYGGYFIKVKYTDQGRPGYYCELCVAEMNAKKSLAAHCEGMKHLKKKAMWERNKGLVPEVKKTDGAECTRDGSPLRNTPVTSVDNRKTHTRSSVLQSSTQHNAVNMSSSYTNVPPRFNAPIAPGYNGTPGAACPVPAGPPFPIPIAPGFGNPRFIGPSGLGCADQVGPPFFGPVPPPFNNVMPPSFNSPLPTAYNTPMSSGYNVPVSSHYSAPAMLNKPPVNQTATGYDIQSPAQVQQAQVKNEGTSAESNATIQDQPEEYATLKDSPTGLLITKLASCHIENEEDGNLALSVISTLSSSLRDYYSKQGEKKITELLLEAELKFNTLKALKVGMRLIGERNSKKDSSVIRNS